MTRDDYTPLVWAYLETPDRPKRHKQAVYQQVLVWVTALSLAELCRALQGAPGYVQQGLALQWGQSHDLLALSEPDFRLARRELPTSILVLLETERQRQFAASLPPKPIPLPLPEPEPKSWLARIFG